jgi:hypothetical protein
MIEYVALLALAAWVAWRFPVRAAEDVDEQSADVRAFRERHRGRR